jgi:hypothetical protein
LIAQWGRIHSFEGSKAAKDPLKGDAAGRRAMKVRATGGVKEEGVMAASVGRAALRVVLGVVIIAAFTATSAAKAGLISTGPASYCNPSSGQAFARWGDPAYYTLFQNGGFESGSTSWALGGGAKVVSGNEPFFLRGSGDKSSLLLPAGSSATSGTMCFALGDWHLRLMMRNVGSSSGSLHVTVLVPSLVGGLLTVLDGGTVTGGTSWAPSPRLQLLLSNVTSLLGTKAVAFRFTPVGRNAAYQIDDVYLDPWKCT